MQDPRDVVEVLSMQMPFLFACVQEDPKLLRMIMILLQSSCQRQFASILLSYLLDHKLETLSVYSSTISQPLVVAELLDLIFPYLRRIVHSGSRREHGQP